ncbi:non-ribosomal peptide synthetase, partial [Bacillus cereus]|uniref:non-ribosomal peptide synthetase n=1 Tax=Bacillus cereus TaxID=1396 RepID=UPI00187F73BB
EQQMLLEWNKTETEYPKDECVHQLFQGQVELYPDTIAVTYEDKHISYSELNYKANQLAHYLKRFGVGPDVLVGIHMERSVDMIIGLLGILKAGGAYVPLDTTYPKERLAFMLEDSKVPILLTQERLVEGLPEHNSKIVSIDTDWINISKESSRNLDVNTTPENLAYIIYTSGSTGRPKGVCVPHKAINRLVCNTNYVTFQHSFKVAQASNTSFDAATFEIWGALLNGAGMVIISKDVLLAPREFATIIKKCKINIMFLTTALFNQFSRELPSIFNSMTVLFGGEAVDSKSVREVIKKGKPKRLLHVYGPTESTTFTTWYLVENVPGDATNIPIGRPIANTEIYVLNQNLQPLSIGVPGELYIGGEGVARGYLNQPELTEEKFILNPFVSDSKARLYKTGDLVRYLPDGNIEFLGRIDNQVKIRGFRIELGEIETIIGQHPAILKTVVLAQEQEQEQESNNKSLVAYVVQNPHYESGEEGKELQGEQTEQWEMIFDNFYTQSPRTSDPTFNIIGWNSSYTGEPIPEGEMQYWLKTTVERILDLKPQVALEIGCGTGMILNRIAPKCKHYYGTDISNKALNYIQKQIIERGKLSANVKLLHQSADNFQDLHDREFDSIIMNSVIQYFPSIEYLVRVLEESVKLIDSKGSIFLGDIRSLPLVEAFHTKVEMHHSKTNVTIEQFKKNVENRIKQDNELVIDPEFFYALQRHIPEINDVVILPKMGEFANELTSFRYDVVLKIGTEPVLKTNYPSLDWNKNNLSLPLIRKQLENEDTRILEINNIKDARVNKDILLIDLLKNNLEIKTVADLRTLLEKENEDIGLNPEDFWRMAAELSYDVEIKLSEPVISGRFNIIFKRQGLIEPLNQNQIRTNNIKREVKSWKIYSNNPLQKKFVNTVVPEIKSYLKSKLPDYMIPTYFVLMDRFSLTPNGKVDRSKLPIPSRERIDSESTDYCMPRNPIEELVAGIWTELLNVNKIGIYENFFDLGGHSLLATQIVSRLRNILQIEVTVRSIFDAPSIAGLSEKIYALMGVEYKNQIPQTTINETEIKRPLSFAQQRLLFLEEFTSGKSLYSIPVALRLKGPLNVKVLQQSLNEITRRHQALRTVFDNIKGEQVQIIKPHQGFNLSIKDFTEYPKEQRDLLVKQFIKSEVIRPFDLVQGPLFRTYLIYVDKTEYVLLLNMHHIISDGWSMGVLAKELFTLYEAFSIGDESPLPDLPIQYVDYAVWQREWLKEEVLEHQLAYWKKQLSGELPILDLSTNLTRPTAATFRGKVEKFILSEKLTEDLKKLSRQEGTTLFMTLLAAFKALIYRYTSEEDILIGAPIANRNWGEIEKLIGFFVNTLTLRTKLSDDLTFIELMKRVREVSLDAYANQDVPFEKVVEELQPERNINQSPLFQVMFQLTPEYNFKLSNLTVDPLEVHTETAKFDLYLPMTEEGNQLVGRLEYNSDVFSLIRIKQIIKHFEILLEGIVCNPSQAIKDIPLLSEHENDTLL